MNAPEVALKVFAELTWPEMTPGERAVRDQNVAATRHELQAWGLNLADVQHAGVAAVVTAWLVGHYQMATQLHGTFVGLQQLDIALTSLIDALAHREMTS